MVNCEVCQEKFENDTKLHRHLKSHKMNMTYYYQVYFPRYDRFDGKIIKFKNKDYYFNSDFNSRENLRSWVESVPTEESRQYVVDYLSTRKNKKGMVYAPTQSELRTLLVPGMHFIRKKYGDYYQFCESLGLKNKFKKYKFDKPLIDISKSVIVIDTREQQPLHFSLKTEEAAVPYGDYKLKDVAGCYIERKALGDFYGTMTGHVERFSREIERAAAKGDYIVVVVEATFDDVYAYQGHLKTKSGANISPEYILHNMRDIIQKYENVQFLFVKNRNEASRIIEKLFACDGQYVDVDLQYAYDTKEL